MSSASRYFISSSPVLAEFPTSHTAAVLEILEIPVLDVRVWGAMLPSTARVRYVTVDAGVGHQCSRRHCRCVGYSHWYVVVVVVTVFMCTSARDIVAGVLARHLTGHNKAVHYIEFLPLHK